MSAFNQSMNFEMLVKFQLGFVWQRTRNTYNNFNKSCLCALWGTGLKNKYFFTKFCWPTTWNNTFDMIWLNIKEHICQHLENRLGFGVSVCPLRHRDEEKMLSTGLFVANNLKRKWLFGVFEAFWDYTEGVILSNYN